MNIPHDLRVIGACVSCHNMLSESVDDPDNTLSNVGTYDFLCKECEKFYASADELGTIVNKYGRKNGVR